MKNEILVLLSLLLMSLFFSGCETEKKQITATLTDHSGCKVLKSASVDDVSGAESCISYSYNSSTGILSVTHNNAAFNCCPGELECDVIVVGDTLVIKEKEEAALCDCDCLYDLSIEVRNLDMESYIIKIVEPYCGDQQQLIFGIDLANKPTGSFCVKRNSYPWGLPL